MKKGKCGTPEYETWQSIKQRCQNPNNFQYHRYGGRGITLSSDWQKFDNFYRDMGARPNGHQIDRTDNDKGYCKENCKWVLPKENAQNRRNTKGRYLLGVSITRTGRFASAIKIEGMRLSLGAYETEIEAHCEYLKIYKEWFGKMPLMGERKCLQRGMV